MRPKTLPPRLHVRSLLAAPASSLPHSPTSAPLSCETFRPEPATRRFVWSFAPMPMSRHRVEHQNGSGPPPVFPPDSPSTGIVHRLSGPTSSTHRSPTAPALKHSPRAAGGLLGPCFNTGPSPRRPPHFHSFTANRRLFILPSRYFFAIGLTSYLAFDAITTASHCTTKQYYSSHRPQIPGLSPA